MMYRTLAIAAGALGVAMFAAAVVPAGEQFTKNDRHDGTVVSVSATKLVMRDKARDGQEGKEYTHTLAENAKVTCDGKACRLEDLKAGQRVRVTSKGGERTVVTRVEALSKNTQFEGDGGNRRENRESDREPR